MPSPTVEVQINGGAWSATTNGVDLDPSDTIKFRLASNAGVRSWSFSCTSTDETSDVDDFNSTLAITSYATNTFTVSATAGKAYIFTSEVDGGVDINGEAQSSYTVTVGVYILTDGGNRVTALGETLEGGPYGWVQTQNEAIRALDSVSATAETINVATADSITKGDILTYDTASAVYKKSSSANLGASKIAQYIALTDAVASGTPGVSTVEYGKPGDIIPASVTGLSTVSSQKRCRINTTTGKAERRDSITATDYDAGIALADGQLVFLPALVNPDATGILWFSPLNGYGALADGSTSTVDAQAIQAVVDGLGTMGGYRGGKIGLDLSPRGSSQRWMMNTSVIINDDTTYKLAGLYIRGNTGAPSADYLAAAPIRWVKTNKKITSTTCTVTASATVTATSNNRPYTAYVTLSHASIGALGITATEVKYCEGLIENSSYSALDGYVKLVAASGNTVTFGAIVTAGSVPGSITLDFKLLDSPFHINARNVFVDSLYVEAYGSGVDMFAAITSSESPDSGGGITTRQRFRNISVDANGSATAVHAVHCGAPCLPQSGNSNYLDSTLGYPTPWMPSNCDFLTLDTVTCSYGATGAFFHTHNTAQQNRGHRFIECQSNGGGRCTSVEYVHAGTALGASSTSFTAYDCVASNAAGMWQLGKYQAPITIIHPHYELVGKLFEFNQTSISSPHHITVIGGYHYFGSSSPTAGYTRNPFIDVNNAEMIFKGCKFRWTGDTVAAGTSFFYFQNYKPKLTLIGCELPDATTALNNGQHFEIGSVTGGDDVVIELIGCTEYTGSATYELVNEKVYRTAASDSTHNKWNARRGSGQAMRNIKGLSGTRDAAYQFMGEVTISESDTRGVLPFTTTEDDPMRRYNSPNSKLNLLALPSSYTGSPTDGSLIVKKAESAMRYAAIELLSAPGTSASRTFQLLMMRHDNRPASAWHPAKKSSLGFWLVSDQDFGIHNRSGNYTFWRNQVADRGSESALDWSQADPAIDHSSVPTEVPSLAAADPNFNNRTPVSFSGNDWMIWNYLTSGFACLATPCTIFFVARAGSDISAQQILFDTQSDGIAFYANTSGEINILAGGTTSTLTGSAWHSNTYVLGVKIDGASSKHFLNTTTGTGITLGTSSPASTNFMYLGRSLGGAYWKGKLGEIVIFREALPDTEIASEMQRLGTAWNITIT